MSEKKKKVEEQEEMFPELKEGVEAEEERAVEEAQKEKTALDIIKEFKDGPSDEQVEQWKTMFGENNIFASMYSEDELYVYRPITRTEWKSIMMDLAKAPQDKRASVNEEMVVQRCMLFPQFDIDFKAGSKAGTISSIYTQILIVSNFMNDAVLEQLIVKL